MTLCGPYLWPADVCPTYLAQQQDRRLTAVLLGPHPSTVDNRLARLAELHGLDLGSPRGTAPAIAALLPHDTGQGSHGSV
ncbi:helix-turn-helix domain-containing protein [Streptomyces sp. NBC_00184]|uniref:helix-turn-helix domain-containing protein n=1 Tax=Streptomyces sp. NBC_00184 TaxID=2975673 RepID=UPI002E2A054D|nr:helix-turn-helix domain-containing protein [Streptomyces sp. NBC_00184]